MKKILFVIGAFLFFLNSPLHSENVYVSPQEVFAQANQAFEKGDFTTSLESYKTLLSQGFESPALYYNLGNIHYRRGERGRAILWYERAARLSPRDSDIQFNLTLARSHIREDEKNWMESVILYYSNNELSWVVLIFTWLFFIALGGVTLNWIRGVTWPTVHLWLTGSMLMLSASWLTANTLLLRKPMGIVVAPPGEVRNGPGQDYAVGFTIPEGSKVIVINKRPDWVQVGVPQQGLKGWLPAKEVESISATSALLS